MKHPAFCRLLPLAAAALLLFSLGCGSPAAQQKATPASDAAATETEPDASAAADYSSLFSVEEATTESASESYATDEPDENAVLVQSAGVLTMTGADINKLGDAEGDPTGGRNAAVAVLGGGQLTLLRSNITTNALGAFGIYLSGEGSTATAEESYLSTAGNESPALVAEDGGVLTYIGGTLATEGTDSPCVLLNGGRVLLRGVTLSSAGAEQLRILGGENELTLDQTTIASMSLPADGSTLTLTLLNGASFTGELGGVLPAMARVSLDASSTLTLTAETYLSAFVNADTTHANIQSNGFNLYYDSGIEENAYLGGQSYVLPSGGFLAPII